MIPLIVLFAAIILIAFCVARWTHLHPLNVAALGGLPGGAIALLLPMEMTRESLAFSGIVYVITTVASAFGAFPGWLRRKNLERTRQ